jgi:hypothetical protein
VQGISSFHLYPYLLNPEPPGVKHREQAAHNLEAMTPGRRWINGPNKARNGPANRILLIKVLPGKNWQRGKEGAKVFSKKIKFSTHFVTSSAVNAGHEAPATYKRA